MHPFAASLFPLIDEFLSGLVEPTLIAPKPVTMLSLMSTAAGAVCCSEQTWVLFTGHLHSRVGASLGAARAPSHPSSAGQGTLQEPLQVVMHPSMVVLLVTSDR